VNRKVTLFDKTTVPNVSEKLVLGHNLPGIFDQKLEYVERSSSQFETLIAFDHRAFEGVEQTVAELVDMHGMPNNCFGLIPVDTLKMVNLSRFPQQGVRIFRRFRIIQKE
jgi:hypothetical protein